jgi:nuclear GTP-binding protein
MAGASRIVLRDWSAGKFPRCTTPPTTKSIPSLENISMLYTDDLNILATSPSRKEMWKSGGLVKLVPGHLELRKAVLDAPWARLDEEQGGEVGGSAEQDSVEICDHGSRDDPPGSVCDEEEVEMPEDETPRKHLNKVKRKREIEHAAPRPVKKVVFASAPKGKNTKDFRTAESLDRKISATAAKGEQSADHDDDAYDFSKFF